MLDLVTILIAALVTVQTDTDIAIRSEPERAPVRVSKVLARKLAEDPDQKYFLYLPGKGGVDAPVFVTVHGTSRNAREHAKRFAPLAERYGVVLVAPLFPKDRFPDYQRLGRKGKGARADRALDMIAAEVGRLTGAKTDKLYLFGYSGGGQFVHRYAMAHPERVASMVVGAAGWYTFPDPTVDYPFGIRRAPGLPDVSFNPARFLTVPACVLVGKRDVERDLGLNRSRRIDRHQGTTRLERGKRWIQAMAASAEAYNLDTSYVFRVLPGSDHSFADAVRHSGMDERVFGFLFGQERDT